MNKFYLLILTTIFAICAACGAKTETVSNNKANATTTTATENKSSASNAPSTANSGAASAIVKEIYDHAIKRECAAIPPMLTEEFRKEVGTSKDSLDALCDTFTDSGKITSVEMKGEEIKGDSATVKVSQTFKDGKKEDKEEKMKKSADGKWLMES